MSKVVFLTVTDVKKRYIKKGDESKVLLNTWIKKYISFPEFNVTGCPHFINSGWCPFSVERDKWCPGFTV